MSYAETVSWDMAIKRKSTAVDTAVNLVGAAASYAGYAIMAPIALKRLLFHVTIQVTAGTTAPVIGCEQSSVTFVRRVTFAPRRYFSLKGDVRFIRMSANTLMLNSLELMLI